MNEVEMELSRLFNAAVGEPPRRVTLRAVRRKVIRRRIVAGAGATAAVSLAVSLGLAVSANALGPHPAVRHSQPRNTQRYYFEAGYPETIFGRIRSVATGEIKRRIECPRSVPVINATAAASDRTFFISCSTELGKNIQVYRVGIGKSGRFGDLQPVPGGRVSGVRAVDRYVNMAVTASGSELAIATARLLDGQLTNIIVINTKTGAHALWHAAWLRPGVSFGALDLSFARNGSELAVFGVARCVNVNPCLTFGAALITLQHPARGGRLASGRIIFREHQIVKRPFDFAEDAYISPDGRSAVVAVQNHAHGSTIYRVSAATGRPERVLIHLPDEVRFIIENSFGQVLFSGLGSGPPNFAVLNGWISHGTLIPLPTAGQVRTETW